MSPPNLATSPAWVQADPFEQICVLLGLHLVRQFASSLLDACVLALTRGERLEISCYGVGTLGAFAAGSLLLCFIAAAAGTAALLLRLLLLPLPRAALAALARGVWVCRRSLLPATCSSPSCAGPRIACSVLHAGTVILSRHRASDRCRVQRPTRRCDPATRDRGGCWIPNGRSRPWRSRVAGSGSSARIDRYRDQGAVP